ncbi:Hypp2637 [Branchiostoma lanceolatum]|uniref:Hypp2637 protein n=1 Tax=Branchiostoma lanceolatum TaxID=7740 RepID=A0A8K0ENY6_BRALA|nr:Hypp2637 [Branchiostoma lanceolatum]
MSHGFLPAIQVNGQTRLPPSPPHKHQNLNPEPSNAATTMSATEATQSRPTARLPGITRKDSDFINGGKGSGMESQEDTSDTKPTDKQVRKKCRSPRRRKKMNSWHSWPDVDSPDRMFPDIMSMDSKEGKDMSQVSGGMKHGKQTKLPQLTANTTQVNHADNIKSPPVNKKAKKDKTNSDSNGNKLQAPRSENINHGVILPPLGHGANWKTFQRNGEDTTTRCKSVDSEVGSASEETDSRMSSPELDLKCTSWLEGLRRAQSDDLLLVKQAAQMK